MYGEYVCAVGGNYRQETRITMTLFLSAPVSEVCSVDDGRTRAGGGRTAEKLLAVTKMALPFGTPGTVSGNGGLAFVTV